MIGRRLGSTENAARGSRRRRVPWGVGVALLACSALLTVFSESFYWYTDGIGYPGRVVFYLIPTTALLWAVSRWPSSGRP